MIKNDDILDQLLKSSLAGLEGDVSPDAWEAISGGLDQLEKKRRPVYWWLAGLLVIGLGIGISMLWNNNSSNGVNLVESSKVEEIPSADLDNQKAAHDLKSQVSISNESVEAINNSTKAPIQSKLPGRTKPSLVTEKDSYILPSFNAIALNIKPLNSLSDFSLANPDLSIFIASEMGANDFYNIPTNNNGKRKGQLTPMNEGSWEFGLSASPALASRLATTTNSPFSGLLNNTYKAATSNAEHSRASYQVGFNVRRYLSDRVYLATAFQYDQIGESVDYNYTIKEFPYVNLNENRIERYVPLHSSQWENVQFNGHNTYHFIEIPLKLGIVVPVNHSQFKWKSEAGLQYMFLTGSSGKKVDPTYLELIDLKPTDGYSRNNLGGMVSSGVFSGFGNNLEWGVSPYGQFTFTSIRDKQSPLKDKPFSYGVNLQLTYKLLNNKR